MSNIKTYVKQFATYLEERHKAKPTILIYTRTVKNLLEMVSKNPDTLVYKDIEKYTKWALQNYDTNALTPIYAGLRKYLKYLKIKHNKNIDIGLDEDDLLRPPTWVWKPKDVLTKDEILAMFKASEKDPRDNAILKTFFYTAQRKSSIENLNINDINFEEQTVNIKAKGNREYKVDIHPDAIASIQEYLKVREQPKKGHEQALFLNGYGKRLQGQTMALMMKRYASKIGIKKRIYPHLWRSSSLTLMNEQGASLPDIMAQSGHKDIRSLVNAYIKPSRKHIQNEVRRTLDLNHKPEPQQPKPQPKPEPKHEDKTDKYIALLKEGVINKDEFMKLVDNDRQDNDTPNYYQ